MSFSADATLSKSCVGCHGRDEDVTNSCVGGGGTQVECGFGAGLRLVHETNVGAKEIILVSFFTCDSDGNQVWLIGSGLVNGSTVTIDFEIPVGAKWGSAFNPADVMRTAWGTGTFTFTSCEAGHAFFAPNATMQAAPRRHPGEDGCRPSYTQGMDYYQGVS